MPDILIVKPLTNRKAEHTVFKILLALLDFNHGYRKKKQKR